MSTITASMAYSPGLYSGKPGLHLVGRVSDGTLLALTQPAVGVPHCWTSADGITWVDRGALPGTPPDLRLVFHAQIISDVVWLWFVPSWVVGSTKYGSWSAPWDGTTPLGTSSTNTYSYATGSSEVIGHSGAAFHLGAAWHILIVPTTASTTGHITPYLSQPGGAALQLPGTTRCSMGTLLGAGTTLFVGLADNYRGQVEIIQLVISGGSYSAPGTPEVVAGFSGLTYAVLDLHFDNAGTVDCLYSLDGTALYTRKRTGTNSFALAATWLANLNTLDPTWTAVHDTVTDDLWVAWSSAQTYPNGEIYARRRQTGTWRPATLLAGGDDTGWVAPLAAAGIGVEGVDLVFIHGTATPADLDYAIISGGSAPSKPTGLTTGTVATLTPALFGAYRNAVATDLEQYRQVQVYADAGMSTLVTDTGQQASASQTWTYTGPTLAYTTTYWWRVRYWDSVTNTGAGTASPWSDLTPITIRRGAAITITDVLSAGLHSLTTLFSGTFAVTFGYAQADGDHAGTWRALLWSADGTTAIGATPLTPFSPLLADGGSVTTPAWASAVSTGTTVNLQIETTDAVTGVVSHSALLPLSVAFVPPTPPSAVTVTPIDDAGHVEARWTPTDPDAVASYWSYKDASVSAWTDVPTAYPASGPQTILLHPDPTRPYDYRVWTVDSHGRPSRAAVLAGITLGLQADTWGFWITLNADPAVSIAFGAVDSGSWDAVGYDDIEDEVVWVPVGGTMPLEAFGPTDYREGTQFKFRLYADTVLSDGTLVDPWEIIATLRTRMRLGVPLLVRDPYRGRRGFFKLSKVRATPYLGGHAIVSFTLRGTDPPPFPLY